VAVVLAVVTGGSVLTVVVVTGLVGLVAVGYQAGLRRYRRRHVRRPASGAEAGPAAPPDAELNRWMAAVQRVLTSHD
jgi:hypothetical protein